MISNIYLTILWCLMSCTWGQQGYKLPYDLSRPDLSFMLSDRLEEISGMQVISDSIIVAIQDEEAVGFYINSRSGKIIDQYDFGKDGDYEGITKYKNSLYILRSDGSIFKSNPDKETKKYKFEDSKGFDFEGVCLDASHDRLLVACKEHGDKDKRDHIFIYSFSLESKKYMKKPVFKIDKDRLNVDFRPSGIAIHPNGNIYVLSSFSKTLLVLAVDGTILNYVPLNKSIFHQPEGITFNQEGDLYISNEKNDKTPNVLKFEQRL